MIRHSDSDPFSSSGQDIRDLVRPLTNDSDGAGQECLHEGSLSFGECHEGLGSFDRRDGEGDGVISITALHLEYTVDGIGIECVGPEAINCLCGIDHEVPVGYRCSRSIEVGGFNGHGSNPFSASDCLPVGFSSKRFGVTATATARRQDRFRVSLNCVRAPTWSSVISRYIKTFLPGPGSNA